MNHQILLRNTCPLPGTSCHPRRRGLVTASPTVTARTNPVEHPLRVTAAGCSRLLTPPAAPPFRAPAMR